jgi:Cu+-exporting ATPase
VSTITPLNDTSVEELLYLAAASEHGSEHPVGRAIVDLARKAEMDLPPTESFFAHAGQGVQALVEGHTVLAGRASWLELEWSLAIPASVANTVRTEQNEGATVIVVAWDGQLRGIISIRDAIKSTSIEAISRLKGLGLHPILMTGDNGGAARTVATQVLIDDVYAGITPQGKLDLIYQLQRQGKVVAMVGDGVNDAAALAAADLGIAMGTGTDAAIAASDITVVSGNLLVVADAVELARRTLRTIKGNLFWAFAYNIAAIPIAMLGLLNPFFAGAAMAFSSVFVVTNSLRLRRFTPSGRIQGES